MDQGGRGGDMTDRDTLTRDGVDPAPQPPPRPPRFGGGYATLAVLAALLAFVLVTCDSLPEDYSRLRSQSAPVKHHERKAP